jgi:acetyltransferase-like isoleucine patch superfamily enzyme
LCGNWEGEAPAEPRSGTANGSPGGSPSQCVISVKTFPSHYTSYLIEIGNRVGIAAGTRFVTHEGSAWLLRQRFPNIQVFGRIRVGDDTLIGMNCIILPGTTIGARCVVGAGSVVKGTVADGTVVAGNPARLSRRRRNCLARSRAVRTVSTSAAQAEQHLTVGRLPAGVAAV